MGKAIWEDRHQIVCSKLKALWASGAISLQRGFELQVLIWPSSSPLWHSTTQRRMHRRAKHRMEQNCSLTATLSCVEMWGLWLQIQGAAAHDVSAKGTALGRIWGAGVLRVWGNMPCGSQATAQQRSRHILRLCGERGEPQRWRGRGRKRREERRAGRGRRKEGKTGSYCPLASGPPRVCPTNTVAFPRFKKPNSQILFTHFQHTKKKKKKVPRAASVILILHKHSL